MSHSIAVKSGRGRRRDPNREAFWRAAVARQQHGGLAVRAFCAGEALAESAFYFWRRELQRRRRGAGHDRQSAATFVQLTSARGLPPQAVASLPVATSTAAIELCLPPQRRLLIRSGCDMATLRQVLAVLEGTASGVEAGMLRLPTLEQLDQTPVRIFLCMQATDMRRSFDRLCAMVQQALAQGPLSGDLFVFRSRGSDKLKILYWDKDGFCIWYKRLEEGTFRFPRVAEGQSSLQVKASELAMLLEGIDLRSIKRGPRFTMPQKIFRGKNNSRRAAFKRM